MSSSIPGQASAPSSDSKSILDAALSEYEEKTGKPLFDDPVAAELQGCESVNAMMALLLGQLQALCANDRLGDKKFMEWTRLTADVFYAFSETLSRVAGIVRH